MAEKIALLAVDQDPDSEDLEHMDVDVLDADYESDPHWGVVLDVPMGAGHEIGIAAAERALRAAGWEITGPWSPEGTWPPGVCPFLVASVRERQESI